MNKPIIYLLAIIFLQIPNYKESLAISTSDIVDFGGEVLSHASNKKIKLVGKLIKIGNFLSSLLGNSINMNCSYKIGFLTDTLTCISNEKLVNGLNTGQYTAYLFYINGSRKSILPINSNKLKYFQNGNFFGFSLNSPAKNLEFIIVANEEGNPVCQYKF
ncbi:MAG: hypothetical protein HDQ93_06510 [Desulfovibrio sp.]|nr:hypothetical protein [Desulfovibrio sp.]